MFKLVLASYDEVPLTAQCFLETSEMSREPRGLAQDHVIMSMSDQSGYFVLPPPETGWTPGLYRCGLFMGERTTADTQVDEVRFRIVAPPLSSVHRQEGAQAYRSHIVIVPLCTENDGGAGCGLPRAS